jgi:hypothetical protein
VSWTMFCTHGVEMGDRPPCNVCQRKADFHYCAHGVDQWAATDESEPRCPFCRGVTRSARNSAVPGFRAGPRVTYPHKAAV